MKIAIFNGSPRAKKSNSTLLTEQFLKGYSSVCLEEVPVFYLAITNHIDEFVKAFQQAETAIVIMPLYTDCMPGIVKFFLENVYNNCKDPGKRIGFIVQSGFPESFQSKALERYLEKFCKRMGFHYLGTIIKGGVEGIQIMPPVMTNKLYNKFYELGYHFALNNEFSPKIKAELAKPLHLSPARRFSNRIFSLLGFTNFYWDSNLKKNNAYEKRFDKPFA
ncbi:MAG: NAD(P)H-dependent oxidoreductase [Bacteroidales bacterium]|nr:NAD(P)H-dependent oxidoreductase [Bacteroidales bacterium]